MNNLATRIEIDLENGFAYATDDLGENNYFQACLVSKTDKNGEFLRHRKMIDSEDTGYDWGVCGDHNSSIEVDNQESLNKFLELAKNNGIIII